MNLFKKPLLGVDLGSRTIKGIQLKKDRKGKVSVANHFFQDLALTSPDFPAHSNLHEAFKAALEVNSLSASQTATTVKDSEVLSFNLELPEMSAKELDQVVPLEVAEQAMIDLDEHSLDYVVYPNLVKAHCVKKEVVLNQMKVLESVGLKPTAIESEMMAITAMLGFNEYINPAEVTVVFDLGESHVNSGVITDGILSLTRTHRTSFGSANVKLMELCNISYQQAEQIKLNYDFFEGPGDEKTAITALLDDTYTEIFKTIKSDIEFYQECPESLMRVDRILLVGGGSQIKSAVKLIEKFLNIPAVVVNPFRNIDIFEKPESAERIAGLAPFMSTAVGLALHSFAKGRAA